MNNKLNELLKFSDPSEVERLAKHFNLNTVQLSSKKDKKYMVFDGQKMIHFGQMGYEDYTKHKDEKRLSNFRKRNHRWASASVYSAAWLSYYLLW